MVSSEGACAAYHLYRRLEAPKKAPKKAPKREAPAANAPAKEPSSVG